MSTELQVRSLVEQIDWAVGHDQGGRARSLARQLADAIAALDEPHRTLALVGNAAYLKLARVHKPRPAHDNRAGRKRVDRRVRRRPAHDSRARADKPARGQLWETVGITCVDGEGWGEDASGRQDYRLLVAVHIDGTGQYRWRLHLGDGTRRLHSVEILDWLCRLPGAGHLVGFSLGYDVAQWLRDVPPELLDDLVHGRRFPKDRKQRGVVRWQHGPDPDCDWFDLQLIPGKMLAVSRPRIGCHSGIKGLVDRRVWDAFGWYQQSFLAAATGNAAVPPALLAVIERGKAGRSDEVKAVHGRGGQLDYASAECLALAKMQHAMYGLWKRAGYELKAFHGPGAGAAAMLERHRIMEHAGDGLPGAMREAVQCGYFGGRFENALLGIVPRLWQYDLRSAYPWAATQLPSLTGARWVHIQGKQVRVASDLAWRPGQLGVYRIRWSWPPRVDRLNPFPVRMRDQTICWPPEGESWVWHPELEAAAAGGWDFEVIEGWRLEPASDGRPFAFLADVYAEREQLKAAHDPTQIVFKLGPNSVYGKLVQGVGSPRYQQAVWGSLITSLTRARLVEVIGRAPAGTVVVTATDGLYSLLPLGLEILGDLGGEGLGSWEPKGEYADVLISGSGFMHAEGMDSRTRGMRKADAPFDRLRDKWHAQLRAWEREGLADGPAGVNVFLPSVEVTVRTFVGIALGLLWRKPELIGAWIDQTRVAAFGADKSPTVWGWYTACEAVGALRGAVWVASHPGPGAADGIVAYDENIARSLFALDRAVAADNASESEEV